MSGRNFWLVVVLALVSGVAVGCRSTADRSRAPDFAYVSRDAMDMLPDAARYEGCAQPLSGPVTDWGATYELTFVECAYEYYDQAGTVTRGFVAQFGFNANGISWRDIAGVQHRCSNEPAGYNPTWVSGNFVPGEGGSDTVGLFRATFRNTCEDPSVVVLTNDGETTLLRFNSTDIDD